LGHTAPCIWHHSRCGFARDDFEGCSFINGVGEHDRDDDCVGPIAKAHRKATCGYIRGLLEGSAVLDPDQLTDQLTMLADGATVTAMVTGSPRAANSAANAALALMDAATSFRRLPRHVGRAMA
jgi:hypothetical protein